jgi:hypothetical protein
MGDFTDGHGRTTADRIAAVRRGGPPVTAAQRDEARRLLDALLRAASSFGVELADFDWTVDLPGGCVDVVTARDRSGALGGAGAVMRPVRAPYRPA